MQLNSLRGRRTTVVMGMGDSLSVCARNCRSGAVVLVAMTTSYGHVIPLDDVDLPDRCPSLPFVFTAIVAPLGGVLTLGRSSSIIPRAYEDALAQVMHDCKTMQRSRSDAEDVRPSPDSYDQRICPWRWILGDIWQADGLPKHVLTTDLSAPLEKRHAYCVTALTACNTSPNTSPRATL